MSKSAVSKSDLSQQIALLRSERNAAGDHGLSVNVAGSGALIKSLPTTANPTENITRLVDTLKSIAQETNSVSAHHDKALSLAVRDIVTTLKAGNTTYTAEYFQKTHLEILKILNGYETARAPARSLTTSNSIPNSIVNAKALSDIPRGSSRLSARVDTGQTGPGNVARNLRSEIAQVLGVISTRGEALLNAVKYAAGSTPLPADRSQVAKVRMSAAKPILKDVVLNDVTTKRQVSLQSSYNRNGSALKPDKSRLIQSVPGLRSETTIERFKIKLRPLVTQRASGATLKLDRLKDLSRRELSVLGRKLLSGTESQLMKSLSTKQAILILLQRFMLAEFKAGRATFIDKIPRRLQAKLFQASTSKARENQRQRKRTLRSEKGREEHIQLSEMNSDRQRARKHKQVSHVGVEAAGHTILKNRRVRRRAAQADPADPAEQLNGLQEADLVAQDMHQDQSDDPVTAPEQKIDIGLVQTEKAPSKTLDLQLTQIDENDEEKLLRGAGASAQNMNR